MTSFNTIPSNTLVPIFYAEMDNSAANTAQDSGASLLIGHANNGAEIVANSLVLMPSADYARQICGAGSQLARMVEAYRQTDPFGELYVIAVPESTGAAATVTLTVTGAATETGTVNVYVGRTRVQAPVTNGDNVATIASSIQDAINAVPTLPFTASSSAGVVTLTARHKGLCGNEIPVSLNYYGFGGGEVLPAGVQIAVATGTAGTGAPVLTGAVAAMADEPFDYIGLPFNDTASVNTLVTEMNDTSGRWSYARQLYGHVYTAKIGTLSELVTAGDQFNQQHITLAGYEKETQTPADELAASRTARAAVFIRNDPARPTQTGELVGMLPAPKGKRFTMTEQQTLLSHGVATAYVESGVLRIQRDVTTYRKNAYGVADNSYLDSETLHTSAYVLRKLKSVITSKYGRHKLASDGTRFGPGQAIVTPAVIKGELLATYRQLERAGIVENYELFKQYLVVERDASELSYPTSGAATAQTLMSSCSALDDCISDSFSGFSIDGVADFVQNDVIGNASIMLGYVSDAMKVVDSAVSDAARLLQGDISVLLPPPSSGKNFVEQVQKMWRTGKRLYGNASDLVTMIKTLSGVSLGSDLQPRGVWKTDSKTTATATQQRNVVASTLRTTAISEAAYAVTRLPAPTISAVMQNAAVGQATTPAQSTGWPSVTHPALNNAPAVKNTVDLPTWEELTDIRDTLNTAIDKELSRTTSDALFLALRRVKADLNADINTRLEQSARIIQRTPDEVLPALVLAATWFDNATRDADIIRRNAITHPGFVPVIPLKVPVQ